MRRKTKTMKTSKTTEPKSSPHSLQRGVRRIQLRRTKGWKLPPNTVVVSRPSKWGNPYKVSKKYNAESAVISYRLWLAHDGLAIALGAKVALRGKNLACWCALDKPCHADVLLEIANPPNPNSAQRFAAYLVSWCYSILDISCRPISFCFQNGC
jgi:hypothetical protein